MTVALTTMATTLARNDVRGNASGLRLGPIGAQGSLKRLVSGTRR